MTRPTDSNVERPHCPLRRVANWSSLSGTGPRQPDPDAVLGVQAILTRQTTDFRFGSGAGFERSKVEHRPRDDKMAQLALVGRPASHQPLPRHRLPSRPAITPSMPSAIAASVGPSR